MLLFISATEITNANIHEFQNISCYCLSEWKPVLESLGVFQNISCYCLSKFKSIFKNDLYVFQNISCYCLSQDRISVSSACAYFKTSHVIVYPSLIFHSRYVIRISKHLMLLFILDSSARSFRFSISKHLMLLFITLTLTFPFIVLSFQNISCYCLSSETIRSKPWTAIFQNISCYCLSLAFPRF